MYELSQRFTFDAAHTLQRDIERAGSARIHGHTYHAEVSIAGPRDAASGMVVDLGLLRARIGAVRERLDHHFLDEVAGLGAPTLENLCAYIATALADLPVPLSAVHVWRESTGDGCRLRLLETGPVPRADPAGSCKAAKSPYD